MSLDATTNTTQMDGGEFVRYTVVNVSHESFLLCPDEPLIKVVHRTRNS